MATIYLSSTFSDLEAHRRAVYDVLRQLGHDVRAMEDYVATDARPVDKCLTDVAACDLYVGIFALRYGYIPPHHNPTGASVTELEYRKAGEAGKPRLIFLLAQGAVWPTDRIDAMTGEGEQGRRIAALREELAREHTRSEFRTPEDLSRAVSVAVTGWERSQAPPQTPFPEPSPQDSDACNRQAMLDNVHAISGSTSTPPTWVLVVSVSSGLTFLILLLAIAVWISHPTPFQIFIFRVVLGLAAAAFGATIPGFLRIELPLWGKGLISATGALALFVLVYLVNPPALVDSEHKPPLEIVKQSLAGMILDTQGNPLPGVTVTLPVFSLSDTTDTRGLFAFEVQAEAAASVRLMAQKPGYQTHRQDATLGNTQLSFALERQP